MKTSYAKKWLKRNLRKAKTKTNLPYKYNFVNILRQTLPVQYRYPVRYINYMVYIYGTVVPVIPWHYI